MFENGDPNAINPDLAVDDQADLLPYNKNFEFPVEKLKFNKQLGYNNVFYNYTYHSGPKNLKKSRPKKLVQSNK